MFRFYFWLSYFTLQITSFILLLKIVNADITDVTKKYFLKHKLPYFHKINYLLTIKFALNCY